MPLRKEKKKRLEQKIPSRNLGTEPHRERKAKPHQPHSLTASEPLRHATLLACVRPGRRLCVPLNPRNLALPTPLPTRSGCFGTPANTILRLVNTFCYLTRCRGEVRSMSGVSHCSLATRLMGPNFRLQEVPRPGHDPGHDADRPGGKDERSRLRDGVPVCLDTMATQPCQC
jgi:hypothetical protein